MTQKRIPRWQQGWEPGPAFRDVWRAMTPVQRRKAFFGDLIIIGVALLAFVAFVKWKFPDPKEQAGIFHGALTVPFWMFVFVCVVNWVIFPKIGKPGERD